MVTQIRRTIACVAALIVIAVLVFSLPVWAASSTESQPSGQDTVGFYVRARLPENQVNSGATYFDLRMQPGQRQTVEVEIVNELDTAMDIAVSTVSASTNSNGIIDYRTPNIRDETLAIPFSDISTVQEEVVHLPAASTAIASVTIEMPQQGYDGTVLGSIVMRKLEPETEEASAASSTAASGGTIIKNEYVYIIGVKLTETDTEVLPDFELFNIRAQTVNYTAAVVHYIRNKEAAVVKDMDIDVRIYHAAGGEEAAHVQRTGVDMAPNSVLELAVTTPEGMLLPGEYRSVAVVTLNGESWEFDNMFRIGGEEAETINSGAITEKTNVIYYIPLWLIILLSVLLVLVIALVILLIVLARRRKKDEAQRAEARRQFMYRKPPGGES